MAASSEDSPSVSLSSEPFPREAETGWSHQGVRTPSEVSDLIVIESDLMVRTPDSPRDWDLLESSFHRPGWDEAQDVEVSPPTTTRASSSDVNAFEDFLSAQDPRAQEGLFRMTEAADMFGGCESDYEPLYSPITPPGNSYNRFSPESSNSDSDSSHWDCQETLQEPVYGLPEAPCSELLTGPLQAEADIREYIRVGLDEELEYPGMNRFLMAARNGEFYYDPLQPPPWRGVRPVPRWDAFAWLHLWLSVTQLELRTSNLEHAQNGTEVPMNYVEGMPTLETWWRRHGLPLEGNWWARASEFPPLADLLIHGVPMHEWNMEPYLNHAPSPTPESIPDTRQPRGDDPEIPYGWSVGWPPDYDTDDPDTQKWEGTYLYRIKGKRPDRSQMKNPNFHFVEFPWDMDEFNAQPSRVSSPALPSIEHDDGPCIPYGWRVGDTVGYDTEDPDTWDVARTKFYPIPGARRLDRSQMDNPYFRFVDYRGGYDTDDSDTDDSHPGNARVPSIPAESEDDDMSDYDGDDEDDYDDQRELEGEFDNPRPMTMLTSSWSRDVER